MTDREVLDTIRKLATEWATQPFDYDEDTEQQIADGRVLLGLLGDAAEPDPPLGYVVGRQTGQGWWTFNRFYGGPEPTRAGSEQSLAGTVEEDGPEAGWQLLEVREVRP